MSKEKHVHQYERVDVGNNGHSVYRCARPDCTHFMPAREMVIGKQSVCYACEAIFILQKDTIQRGIRKPVCQKCKGERKKLLSDLQSNPFVSPESRQKAEEELELIDDMDCFDTEESEVKV